MRLFASSLFALVLVSVLTMPATAQMRVKARPDAKPFGQAEEILKWINDYRLKPDPKRVPEAVRAMSRLGLFKDTESAAVYVGFMAGVIGDNQVTAPDMIAGMFPLPPEDQVALIRAIAYSGLPNWQDILKSFAERMPARTVLIDRYLSGKLPTLAKLPLDESPAALDTLWGYYYATGRFAPVQRIISMLAWSTDKDKLERLTIGSMAKWTLANNATRDVDLLRLMKTELAHQPKAVKEPLAEVIEAAETFETTKIRKTAMASIEELKAKGPETTRNMSWWAQAGITGMALGCVAASAMGQIQFGIPCVIGGPVATAAAKYLIPQ